MNATPFDRELDAVAVMIDVRARLQRDAVGMHGRILGRAIDYLLGTVPSIDWPHMALLAEAAADEYRARPAPAAQNIALLVALDRAAVAATAVGT